MRCELRLSRRDAHLRVGDPHRVLLDDRHLRLDVADRGEHLGREGDVRTADLVNMSGRLILLDEVPDLANFGLDQVLDGLTLAWPIGLETFQVFLDLDLVDAQALDVDLDRVQRGLRRGEPLLQLGG